LVHIHKPDTILDALVMERKLYEVALREWANMEPIGTSFSPQMQKDVSTMPAYSIIVATLKWGDCSNAHFFCTWVHGESRDLVPNGQAISNTELSIFFKTSRTSLK